MARSATVPFAGKVVELAACVALAPSEIVQVRVVPVIAAVSRYQVLGAMVTGTLVMPPLPLLAQSRVPLNWTTWPEGRIHEERGRGEDYRIIG